MKTCTDKPIVIPPELQARIDATQAKQAAEDKIGLQAAGTTLPGPMADVWTVKPDIKEGPYTIRRFVDGDFIRLAQMGHPLDSFTAIGRWLENPNPSGPDAWVLNWMMTNPVSLVKEFLQGPNGVAVIRGQAEEDFSGLDGMQLAYIMRAIVKQIAVYIGGRVDYEPTPREGTDASPPPSLAPSLTVSAG